MWENSAVRIIILHYANHKIFGKNAELYSDDCALVELNH
jgi:hypothetical protein